jgi:hypothetical protein
LVQGLLIRKKKNFIKFGSFKHQLSRDLFRIKACNGQGNVYGMIFNMAEHMIEIISYGNMEPGQPTSKELEQLILIITTAAKMASRDCFHKFKTESP